MGDFYIRDGSDRFLIANIEDISTASRLYSLPSNTSQPPWTEKELNAPIRPDNYVIVLKFWAKYKPGMEVDGEIRDELFYEDEDNREDEAGDGEEV